MTGIAISVAFLCGFGLEWFAVAVIGPMLYILLRSERISKSMAIAVSIAVLVGILFSVDRHPSVSPPWFDTVSAVRGTIASGPSTSQNGQNFLLAVSEVRTGFDWADADETLCVSTKDVPIVAREDKVFLAVSVYRLEDLRPSYARYLAGKGCRGSATGWQMTLIEPGSGLLHRLDRIRRGMADRLQSTAPGDRGALLAGLVTGDDGALSEKRQNAFISTGTTHITAISGSNFALVVISAFAVGARLRVRHSLPWQIGVIVAFWLYALLVGFEPPALRAALIATGAVMAIKVGRRPDLVTLTAIAAVTQLLLRPEDFWTLSFRLSYAAGLAIALVMQERYRPGVRGYVENLLIGTVAAQLATLPILFAAFGRLSPMSLPANIFIAPFVNIAYASAAFAAIVGTFSKALGSIAAAPGVACSSVILRIVDAFAGEGGRWQPPVSGIFANAIALMFSAGFIAALSRDCRRAIIRYEKQILALGQTELILIGTATGGVLIAFVTAIIVR